MGRLTEVGWALATTGARDHLTAPHRRGP